MARVDFIEIRPIFAICVIGRSYAAIIIKYAESVTVEKNSDDKVFIYDCSVAACLYVNS